MVTSNSFPKSLPDLTNLFQLKAVADPGISKRGLGRGPGAVEFLGLGFVLMPLHTYPMCL